MELRVSKGICYGLLLSLYTSFSTIGADVVGDGTATVKILSITNFPAKRSAFLETTAKYASEYCKRVEGNCQAQDKHMRIDQVHITNEVVGVDHVTVYLYITDRDNNNQPALTKYQLADMFRDQKDSIFTDFGHQIEVVHPEHQGWEPWRIAVVTVVAVVVAICIITVIALICRDQRKKNAQMRQFEHSSRISVYDSVNLDKELDNKSDFTQDSAPTTPRDTAVLIPEDKHQMQNGALNGHVSTGNGFKPSSKSETVQPQPPAITNVPYDNPTYEDTPL